LGFRSADVADLPFLRRLYAASRAAEFSSIPWPEETKRAFFDSQFAMQHYHYLTHYASADFLIVLYRHEPIGRLYLHETAQALSVVDIVLEQTMRGRGVGSALLQWLQASVRARKLATLDLHVELRNEAARRLYERHGFIAGEVNGVHLPMTWHA
jgi:ribosomal protein S18 acetylase RimI-like enzyme